MMFDLIFSVTTVTEMKKIFNAFDISKTDERKNEKKEKKYCTTKQLNALKKGRN